MDLRLANNACEIKNKIFFMKYYSVFQLCQRYKIYIRGCFLELRVFIDNMTKFENIA